MPRAQETVEGLPMTTEPTTTDRANGTNDGGGPLAGVVSNAQDAAATAAGAVRTAADAAAERLPAAMATAQVVSRDTARTLEQMPDQALMVGTSFSLGLGVGLFFSGANRLLVFLALAPAAAMAATLMGRESGSRSLSTEQL
jgi:hypothetical protein